MRIVLAALLIIQSTFQSEGQAIYGEAALGPDSGFVFLSTTANFEGAILSGSYVHLHTKIGMGPVFSQSGDVGLFIPMGFGLNLGEGKHRLEISVNSAIPDPDKMLNGSIGYRFQKPGGIMLKAFYSQYATMLIPYFGISVGKNFYE